MPEYLLKCCFKNITHVKEADVSSLKIIESLVEIQQMIIIIIENYLKKSHILIPVNTQCKNVFLYPLQTVFVGVYCFHDFHLSVRLLFRLSNMPRKRRSIKTGVEVLKIANCGFLSIILCSIEPGVMAPDRLKKTPKFWYPAYYLAFNEWISLIFIWYMTINKIPVVFEKKVMYQFGQELWSLKLYDK